MKLRVLIPYLVLAVFLCVGCGKDSQSTIPQSTPAPASGGTTVGPITYQNGDPNQPDLTNAATFHIPSPTDLTGLEAFKKKAVVAPLVGDPLVKLILSGTDASLTGTGRFSVEDKDGLTVRDFPAFAGTGSKTSTAFDIIFSDNEMVVRTKGPVSGDTISGTITYRVRQSSDPKLTITSLNGAQTLTAPPCTTVTLTCQDQTGKSYDPKYCWSNPPSQSDLATYCQNYMTGDANVKTLGTFSASYSTWKQ